jgi:ABC-type dipeptide/oligopeptide/nickel transport system ATPase subunit
MAISWIDFSLGDIVKPFSLNLEKHDFLFLAGEACHSKLLRALAGFLPDECNFQSAIILDGQRLKTGDTLKSILLPKNAAESFPPHRTVGAFILDLLPGITKKKLEENAARLGIEKYFLYRKPAKIPLPVLQKISLWLCSLNTSTAIFVEEPSGGFFDECRPFDFLQDLLRKGITSSIIYLTDKKETILQKASKMPFCRTRLAIFCADRLVEEGEYVKILASPVHAYTKEWLKFGSSGQRKNGALWQYCPPNCAELHNCQAKKNLSYSLLDCEPAGLHKVICRGFFN